MAAIARLTAVRSIRSGGSPRSSPATKITAQITTMAANRRCPKRARRRRSGVVGRSPSRVSPAMRPSSVRAPVATATQRARPPIMRALVHHGRPFGQRRVRRHPGVGVLGHGHRLASQGGLVDAEIGGLDDAQVSRHQVAGLEQDDVAGHHSGLGDPFASACAHHLNLRRAQLLQSGKRPLGPVFLDEADDRVERHDDHDRDRVHGLADQAGCRRRDQQHDDHEVGELPRQHGQGSDPGITCDPVLAVASPPAHHLLVR